MMRRNLRISALFCLVMTFLLSSCSKDEAGDGEYNLTVSIQVEVGDELRNVSNAFVRIYAPVEGSFIDYFQYTDESGETSVSFNNKVIVEIQASRQGFKGCGFAEVNRGSNKVAVVLKRIDSGEEDGCSALSSF